MIVCKNCGSVDDYKVTENGPHRTAWCNGCNSYIKHIPSGESPKMYMGKYKGQEIRSIDDLSYLVWVSETFNFKGNTMKAIHDRINELNGK